ncbi:Uncharacterised protein [Mycobacterium tuberculosis]|nr:Uncharacterised protein [Mycobacterium tuberculosis]
MRLLFFFANRVIRSKENSSTCPSRSYNLLINTSNVSHITIAVNGTCTGNNTTITKIWVSYLSIDS